jgi:hypothetical protein
MREIPKAMKVRIYGSLVMEGMIMGSAIRLRKDLTGRR